ncbi:MAG: YraN family protein [Elusimicrobia bacterium RIFCSPHIGHO2_02_FULL_57_9]|nr:MAG: YraN family protein [Elusimicrobia bacterium RIFCSPHIGHO2_02_FULL_57_9]
MSLRIEIGARAEQKAVEHLKGLGYEILDRNFRLKFGEIDIIARDGEMVVFVEVRYRAYSDFGTAAQTVDWLKQRKIRRSAMAYAQSRRLDCPMRFDVISIEAKELRHFSDAFY